MTLTFFFCFSALAQQQPPVFEKLGTGIDPFPDERFSCILRGSHGFMWFGSARGLLRYDGSTNRWYRHDPDDPTSISSGNVRVLFEDGRQNFWVGTNGGLSLLDRRSGRFTHFRNDPKDSASLSHDNVWSLFQDRTGALWVGTASGLNRMENGGFKRFSEGDGLGESGITAIAEDEDGVLWVGTERHGLRRFDPVHGRFADHAGLATANIRVLHRDRHGRLWVGTFDEGAFFRERDGSRWHSFQHDPNNANSISGNQVTSIHSDTSGNIWIGTRHGLNRFEPSRNGFSRFQNDPADVESLRHDWVIGLHGANDGLVWVATAGAGVDLFNLNRHRFGYYALDGNECWAIHRQGSGPIWAGTKNGLVRLDPKTGNGRWFLKNHVVRSMLPVPEEALFVGTDSDLFRIEPNREGSEPVSLLSGYRIWRILADGDQGLWLATNKGLLRFLPESKTFTAFTADPSKEGGLSHNVVSSLALDPAGDPWVGTFGGGLNRMVDAANGKFQHYTHRSGDKQSLSADDIVDLHFDGRGQLWVATLSGGLNRLDPITGTVSRFTLKSGFPDNAAVSVRSDEKGTIWAHTGVGLVKLDPGDGSFVLYRAFDGVSVGSAIPGSFSTNEASGEMLVGGVAGLIHFQPAALSNPDPPAIIFTSFRKAGREVAHLLLPGEAIQLGRADKSFSIEFAVLDFLSGQDQRFAYRRGGIDDDWVASQNRGLVNYTRYPTYGGADQLLVRGSTGNGLWREASLAVAFEPPLWITWLPLIILLGLCLLFGLTYTLVSFRERRKRTQLEAKARMAEEQRAIAEERAHIAEGQQELARREREFQEEHSRILQDHLERVSTEIANNLHDGPLSELHGIGFRLTALSQTSPLPRGTEDLREVAEVSLPRVRDHLRNICGDLLAPDFRAGLITELDAYADVIEGSHPGLSIDRDFDPACEGLSRDHKAIVYRIFRILLKNVGKHANASQADVRFRIEAGELRLRIEDNGCGFPIPPDWESFKRDRHYGMYMANYFTYTLGGSLTAESEPGKGTIVTVSAPLAR